MEPRKCSLEFSTITPLCIFILISNFAILTDAKFSRLFYYKHITKDSSKKSLSNPNISNQKKFILYSEAANGNAYGAPFSLPPIESLPPFPTPDNNPPYCINPPSPSTTSPPVPPPYSTTPSSPHGSSPAPAPPRYEPSPCNHGPSPPKHGPSPPAVYPPPSVAQTPPHKKPQYAVWCVAKPTVPDLMLQEALDYACGTGADCKEIQPNRKCFQPNTLLSHASYAFNSYWQNRKASGGTCDFGGTAMLVTVDPSFDDCSFIYK